MHLPEFGKPLPTHEKRIILGKPTQQLSPRKYDWMYTEFYKNAKRNHWEPTEVPLTKDIADYENKLTPDEKEMFDGSLAMLTTQDIVQMQNLEEAIERHLTVPEASMYLARQAFEEALHTESYQQIIETLRVDERYIYEMYLRKPSLYAKVEYSYGWHRLLLELRMEDHLGAAGISEFVKAVAFWALGFEGGWFLNGFNFVFSLARRNLMTGSGEIFSYIRRDETMHMNFWVNVINTIRHEHPGCWDAGVEKAIREMTHEVVDLESSYAYDICKSVLGYSAPEYMAHFKFVMNSNLAKLGISPSHEGARPSLWISEVAEINKEKNFFETRVTEYQVGTDLNWDGVSADDDPLKGLRPTDTEAMSDPRQEEGPDD